MIRPDVLHDAALHLAGKGPRATWPLHWASLNLRTAEKDWLIHYESYAAKWPELMAQPEFAPPPSANAEQASSQATALWRGRLLSAQNPVAELQPTRPTALDLTGGSGIDTWGLEQAGFHVTSVEPDAYLAELLAWNGRGSGRHVVHATAESQEYATNSFTWVNVDPSRRTASGRLTFSDLGKPDPRTHLSTWRRWGQHVALKLSPMLDAQAVARWFPDAEELIYVSVRREVKELVVLIPSQRQKDVRIVAVSVDDQGTERMRWVTDPMRRPAHASEVGRYLYDPDSVLAASGGAPSWAAAANLEGLHPDSRLFTSDHYTELPGCRIFRVDRVLPTPPPDLRSASVVCRAFPERADVVRKRLRLAEDSEHFLFATRLASSPAHVYLLATRLA